MTPIRFPQIRHPKPADFYTIRRRFGRSTLQPTPLSRRSNPRYGDLVERRLPSRTATERRWPARTTVKTRRLPGPQLIRDDPHEIVGVATGTPSTRRSRPRRRRPASPWNCDSAVPPRSPARAAGPPGVTRSTSAPRLTVEAQMPRERRASGPRSGRRHRRSRPCARPSRSSSERRAASIGTAKPMPGGAARVAADLRVDPDHAARRRRAAARRSCRGRSARRSGSRRSSWKCGAVSAAIERPTAETTPTASESSLPSGLPIAATGSPTTTSRGAAERQRARARARPGRPGARRRRRRRPSRRSSPGPGRGRRTRRRPALQA